MPVPRQPRFPYPNWLLPTFTTLFNDERDKTDVMQTKKPLTTHNYYQRRVKPRFAHYQGGPKQKRGFDL